MRSFLETIPGANLLLDTYDYLTSTPQIQEKSELELEDKTKKHIVSLIALDQFDCYIIQLNDTYIYNLSVPYRHKHERLDCLRVQKPEKISSEADTDNSDVIKIIVKNAFHDAKGENFPDFENFRRNEVIYYVNIRTQICHYNYIEPTLRHHEEVTGYLCFPSPPKKGMSEKELSELFNFCHPELTCEALLEDLKNKEVSVEYNTHGVIVGIFEKATEKLAKWEDRVILITPKGRISICTLKRDGTYPGKNLVKQNLDTLGYFDANHDIKVRFEEQNHPFFHVYERNINRLHEKGMTKKVVHSLNGQMTTTLPNDRFTHLLKPKAILGLRQQARAIDIRVRSQ